MCLTHCTLVVSCAKNFNKILDIFISICWSDRNRDIYFIDQFTYLFLHTSIYFIFDKFEEYLSRLSFSILIECQSRFSIKILRVDSFFYLLRTFISIYINTTIKISQSWSHIFNNKTSDNGFNNLDTSNNNEKFQISKNENEIINNDWII